MEKLEDLSIDRNKRLHNNDKLVLVQIGTMLFSLKYYDDFVDTEGLKKYLNDSTISLALLKEE